MCLGGSAIVFHSTHEYLPPNFPLLIGAPEQVVWNIQAK
jgi:hypothetical protein